MWLAQYSFQWLFSARWRSGLAMRWPAALALRRSQVFLPRPQALARSMVVPALLSAVESLSLTLDPQQKLHLSRRPGHRSERQRSVHR